jgi:glycosyltransferase involved in cell wall biosynthesis
MSGGELKVLHVIPAVAPRYGGPSRAVFDMCRPLPERGARVLIATTDADGGGCLPVELGREVEYNGIPTIFFSRQFSEAFKYSAPMARWLSRNVAAFDVVHIHAVFSHACLAAARACRRRGVPYIVRPLGTLDPWGMRQKPLRKRLFMRLGVDAMLRGAAAIQYTAAGEKVAVEGALGYGKGVVIPLGIEGASAAAGPLTGGGEGPPGVPAEGPYILFLSRLHHKKGLELLLEAFVPLALTGELSGWRLVVAGDGDPSYVAGLKQKARALGGEDQVSFVGWLDGKAKARALDGASLLALPSYQENFGICLVEAMARGVPLVISPQVNLAPDVEEGGAGWVAGLDVDSLRAALRESMLDGEERRRRGGAGRKLAERFSPAETSRQLLDLYREIMAARERLRPAAS